MKVKQTTYKGARRKVAYIEVPDRKTESKPEKAKPKPDKKADG